MFDFKSAASCGQCLLVSYIYGVALNTCNVVSTLGIPFHQLVKKKVHNITPQQS